MQFHHRTSTFYVYDIVYILYNKYIDFRNHKKSGFKRVRSIYRILSDDYLLSIISKFYFLLSLICCINTTRISNLNKYTSKKCITYAIVILNTETVFHT